MGSYEPKDGGWISERNNQAKSQYGEAIAYMEEVEQLWEANFVTPKHLEGLGIEVMRSSEPFALHKKMNEMVGVRPKDKGRRIDVARKPNSDREMRVAERLERFLKAHWKVHEDTKNTDIWADATSMALLRGKSGMFTTYRPGGKDPVVRTEVLDPMEYFVVYGDDGIDWFTREYWKPRYQVVAEFQALSDEDVARMNIPEEYLVDDEDDQNIDNLVRVIEYCDDDWYAWSIDGSDMLEKWEHGCGVCPLREIRFANMPLKDPRYSTQPFLGPAMGDLKALQVLQSKIATAVQAFYYPKILVKSKSGQIIEWDYNAPPGTPQDAGPDADVTVVRPEPGHEIMRQLQDWLKANVNHSTLPDTVFFREMPNVSGFLAAQVLGTIKDSISAFVAEAERAFGQTCGDVLRYYRAYDDGSGYEYPLDYRDSVRRHRYQETITAEDIDGHTSVMVSIKVALPQDILQVITAANQLRQANPVTGEPYMSEEGVRAVSGLADLIDDDAEESERLEREILAMKDPEVQALKIRHMKARQSIWIEDMEREADKYEKRRAKREADIAERAILNGESADVVIPAEFTTQQLEQVLMLEKQGQQRSTAVEMVRSGMPLGLPGQDQQQPGQAPGGPNIDDLVNQWFGGQPGNPSGTPGQQPGPQQGMMPQAGQPTVGPGGTPPPTGLSGYQGVSPESLPSAMQGGLPRPAFDQAQLQMEQAQQLQQRGALPPPN